MNEIRHDHLGWYICTRAEADYEDQGHPSVGFDGRTHWPTFDGAMRALAPMQEPLWDFAPALMIFACVLFWTLATIALVRFL